MFRWQANPSNDRSITPMFHQIAYVSSALMPLNAGFLSDILESSRRNNLRDGITGVLMYHDNLFFQVLEGEKSLVELCYGRIVSDTRHAAISLILVNPVVRRSFSGWSMEYAGPDDIAGYTNRSIHSLDALRTLEVYQRDRLALNLALQVFDNVHGLVR